MNLGILHLTDIHFKNGDNFDDKIDSLIKICNLNFCNCENIFIIVTGDIAYTGNFKEYELAFDFFENIKQAINSKNSVEIMFVPGNHDCDFEKDSSARRMFLKHISYENLGDDNSIIDKCVEIQKDFFDFIDLFDLKYDDSKLFCCKKVNMGEKKISFIGLNSAWMSSIHEIPGNLFFPLDVIKKRCDSLLGDINIFFYHHPLAWLTPNSNTNNRTECQNYLNRVAQIQLVGHEHESLLQGVDNFEGNLSAVQYGAVFSSSQKFSGFSTLLLNTDSNSLQTRKYNWNGSIYCQESPEIDIKICNYESRILNFKEAFEEELLALNIPIFNETNGARLSDIFVYPDLEKHDITAANIIKDFSPLDIINSKCPDRIILLQGESQVGKTSLLKILLWRSYCEGKTGVLLKGHELKRPMEKLIKDKVSYQYKEEDAYDTLVSMDLKDKILFIDDFQNSNLNAKSMNELFSYFKGIFDKIILCSNDSIRYNTYGLNDLSWFVIKPFGYYKTDELIKKYYLLSTRDASNDKQDFLDQVRSTFDRVRQVLGNKIIPSCPIFIISIVGSLEHMAFDLSNTSFGYCYQSLIYMALRNARISNDDIDMYMNFLRHLSFYFYNENAVAISEEELNMFYMKYCADFKISALENIKHNLLNSRLVLLDSENKFRFGYKYVYYFLVAKYIADRLNCEDGKTLVQNLFLKLHLEDCANILVLISHHSDDISFLEEAQLASLGAFETQQPVTLKKENDYYRKIQELAGEVSATIIAEEKTDPIKERENALCKADKIEEKMSNIPQEVNDVTIPFLRAFRSIDIVGQIVKNRKGSLTKSRIKEMIADIYAAAFRTIAHFGNVLDDTKEVLVESMKEKIGSKDDSEKIKKKINIAFQMLALQACLNVFSKLIYSIGLKDFQEIYNEVAVEMDSPAAKIVSFSINSYYNKISIDSLKKLANELKGNEVALMILRARVKSYIYYNYIEYRERQQLAEILDMKIQPSISSGKK